MSDRNPIRPIELQTRPPAIMANSMKSQLKRYLGSLVFVFLLCLSIALGATAGVLVVYNSDLPQVNSLEDYHPSLITEVYSDDLAVIVTWDEIPQVVNDAI